MLPIKYQYALDSSGRTINVECLQPSKEVREATFICLSCENIVIPVLGEKRRKHFRHKADISCSPETYLHKLAKLTFYEVYNSCLQNNEPFWIEFEVTQICDYYAKDFLRKCEWGKVISKFDLTQYFKTIRLECREDSFIPDLLLLSNKNKKLFIEIAVTHQSTHEKINSAYRIIEIAINDEKDISIISDRFLKESQNTAFYNFERKIVDNFCHSSCIHGIKPYDKCLLEDDVFIIYKSGKSIITRKSIGELEKGNVSYYERVNKTNVRADKLFKIKVIEAYLNNRPIKNCYLCRYHAKNNRYDEYNPVFCKFFLKTCNSNQAAKCRYYKADPKVFSI